MSNDSRSGNGCTDEVVIIVPESESDKVDDQMVSEGPLAAVVTSWAELQRM